MRRKLKMKKDDLKRIYIGCGDLHGTKHCPRYRTDDYWDTWQGKMRWVIEYANKKGARLLIAGDVFDTSRVSPEVINVILAIFIECEMTPYVVAGQHDLKYHTDLPKCPLYTLELAGLVRIIGQDNGDGFAGAGFGEEIPSSESKFLVTHNTITEGEPPFFLTDAVSAKKFMRLNQQFEIIISGDYHVPFHVQKGNQHLINTGTLIRNKRDMVKYKPCIWEITTGNGNPVQVEKVEVPHQPYSKVFDLEAIEYDKEHGITIDTDRLKELIDSGVEENNLESIVWTLFKTLKGEGTLINKELTKEVLAQCERGSDD